MSPTTANAKAEGHPWVSVIMEAGTATLNHENNALTDRTFSYLIIG